MIQSTPISPLGGENCLSEAKAMFGTLSRIGSFVSEQPTTSILSLNVESPFGSSLYGPGFDELQSIGRLRPTLPPGWNYCAERARGIEELIVQLHALSSSGLVFRGEPRHYASHRSGIGRRLAADAPAPLEAECEKILRFISRSHHLLDTSERALCDNMLGYLILMQHHRAPTRLLDWSFSCWVAAYFAACNDTEHDGYIWEFDARHFDHREVIRANNLIGRALEASAVREYREVLREQDDVVLFVEAVQGTARMLAQQSVYTLSHPATLDHVMTIGRQLKHKTGNVLVIPRELKSDIMRVLARMNVTAATLFPGLDGVGAAICNEIQFLIPVEPMQTWT